MSCAHALEHQACGLLPLGLVPWIMDPMQPEPVQQWEITEENLVERGPMVRGLWLARLEHMYGPVERALHRDAAGEMPIDPRLLEIGLRIGKMEADFYRLFRAPAVRAEEEEEQPMGAGVDRAALIESHLVQVQERLEKKPETG